MTGKKRNAPKRAKSGNAGHSHSGVIHVNEPHHDNFTVIGNHLAQHPELSLTAIGLAAHIQSLPAGTPIGIKALAAKFPEGEIRIAAALRELEEHGYLTRARERLQSGQVTTRTTSYNKPRLAVAAAAAPAPEPRRPAPEAPAPASPAPHRAAADLLAGLRARDSRLLLTERDVKRLAPAVDTWLERGVPPTAVARTLTTGLPEKPILHPAAFLAHRLTALLPPLLPTAPPPASPSRPDPLQTCHGCDRAFRAPQPGRCRDCRASGAAA
ncbi:helix-turn-helix domain-containing protein [Streptomyces olivochromogenes]|uniref:helix-turn-helix domain-containing protein n=1 Tax=Streptomyces olivochromogenes TaxID=1963 RepID=UPI001F1A4805|nr:helix-turn-helix domain-containing protein [Streptomyces olivochromogenes]MCF3131038.1 helix-turn-helix domain-containing protein [Streptomyces olivochromogenes]